jgi:acyl carrier protein
MKELIDMIYEILEVDVLNCGEETDSQGMQNTAERIANMVVANFNLDVEEV